MKKGGYMDKNKKNNKNTEFANEFGTELNNYYPVGGTITRNLVKIAEQQLAKETGNDPTPNEKNVNK